MEGWIKLYRNLLTNQLWLKEPFTKGQAWVDILLRVNHQDNKTIIGNQNITVLKGQTLWSMKHMAERWQWSRKKVQLYLEMLKKEHQISYESTTKYTIITIENWGFYQNDFEKGTSSIENGNIKSTSKAHQKSTNKNDNNEKNEKEKIYIDLKFIDDVIDKVKITQEQYSKLIGKFNKSIVHKNIIALDHYITNGKGDKYKDHYRALNTWCSKDKNTGKQEQTKDSWSGMKQFN